MKLPMSKDQIRREALFLAAVFSIFTYIVVLIIQKSVTPIMFILIPVMGIVCYFNLVIRITNKKTQERIQFIRRILTGFKFKEVEYYQNQIYIKILAEDFDKVGEKLAMEGMYMGKKEPIFLKDKDILKIQVMFDE